MFLFGSPTQLINDFLFSLYNENVIRNETCNADPIMFMLGVIELNNDQRIEEIARMLSGSSITDEARRAAAKLLN